MIPTKHGPKSIDDLKKLVRLKAKKEGIASHQEALDRMADELGHRNWFSLLRFAEGRAESLGTKSQQATYHSSLLRNLGLSLGMADREAKGKRPVLISIGVSWSWVHRLAGAIALEEVASGREAYVLSGTFLGGEYGQPCPRSETGGYLHTEVFGLEKWLGFCLTDEEATAAQPLLSRIRYQRFNQEADFNEEATENLASRIATLRAAASPGVSPLVVFVDPLTHLSPLFQSSSRLKVTVLNAIRSLASSGYRVVVLQPRREKPGRDSYHEKYYVSCGSLLNLVCTGKFMQSADTEEWPLRLNQSKIEWLKVGDVSITPSNRISGSLTKEIIAQLTVRSREADAISQVLNRAHALFCKEVGSSSILVYNLKSAAQQDQTKLLNRAWDDFSLDAQDSGDLREIAAAREAFDKILDMLKNPRRYI